MTVEILCETIPGSASKSSVIVLKKVCVLGNNVIEVHTLCVRNHPIKKIKLYTSVCMNVCMDVFHVITIILI